jgi:quaternary ammonium compound-resistance protein SugE
MVSMPWLWLVAAGLLEVVWVVLLKLTDGFTHLWPSVATIAVLAVSFFCMSQALRSLPMGTVYAVWTGIGAVGGIAWGIAMQGEPAGVLRILCLCLILAGVVGLKAIS